MVLTIESVDQCDHSSEGYRAALLSCSPLYYNTRGGSNAGIIEMKVVEQYFVVVPIVILCKVDLIFEPMKKIVSSKTLSSRPFNCVNSFSTRTGIWRFFSKFPKTFRAQLFYVHNAHYRPEFRLKAKTGETLQDSETHRFSLHEKLPLVNGKRIWARKLFRWFEKRTPGEIFINIS